MDRGIIRAVSRGASSLRPPLTLASPHALRLPSIRHASSQPTIVDPAFWKSLVPKFWRSKKPELNFGAPKKPKSKEWNPATFYIVIFLFIGSAAINMIALKKEHSTFMRRAETRIDLLREVVKKLQKGEEVDVEKVLGTGDDEQEQEWAKVLKEIESDDSMRDPKKKGKSKAAAAPAEPTSEAKTSQTAPDPSKAKATSNYSGFF